MANNGPERVEHYKRMRGLAGTQGDVGVGIGLILFGIAFLAMGQPAGSIAGLLGAYKLASGAWGRRNPTVSLGPEQIEVRASMLVPTQRARWEEIDRIQRDDRRLTLTVFENPLTIPAWMLEPGEVDALHAEIERRVRDAKRPKFPEHSTNPNKKRKKKGKKRR